MIGEVDDSDTSLALKHGRFACIDHVGYVIGSPGLQLFELEA